MKHYYLSVGNFDNCRDIVAFGSKKARDEYHSDRVRYYPLTRAEARKALVEDHDYNEVRGVGCYVGSANIATDARRYDWAEADLRDAETYRYLDATGLAMIPVRL